jgi:hypothetical protein
MWTALAILALLVALTALIGLAWLWLSSSWEVVEDDEVVHRIAGRSLRRWFGRKTRLLTYRRDRQGRFRRYRH